VGNVADPDCEASGSAPDQRQQERDRERAWVKLNLRTQKRVDQDRASFLALDRRRAFISDIKATKFFRDIGEVVSNVVTDSVTRGLSVGPESQSEFLC
jgi:hypothetical protein